MPIHTRLAALVVASAAVLMVPAIGSAATAKAAPKVSKAALAFAALPDWRGVWDPAEGNVFDPSAGRSADTVGLREFPPYKPEWEAKYKKELANTASGHPRDPTADCIPPGMPRLMTSPYAWEFTITPDRVLFLKEYQHEIIRVFTDGRKHPVGDALDPSFNGHSIGHWEGDTLVVDTVGMRGDTWFDRTGAPHSDQVHVVQRMRKTGPDRIEDIMTIDDPVAFTKPWTVTRHYKRAKDYEIMEFVCTENNRNMTDANGNNTVVLNKSLTAN
jgi:hypothetical protein